MDWRAMILRPKGRPMSETLNRDTWTPPPSWSRLAARSSARWS